jgi:uncharacterized OsmC-like protein
MSDVVFTVEASTVNSTRVDVCAGSHAFSIDEPVRMGGTDAGPNPVEYLLGALAGCLNVTGHLVAKEMGFTIESMDIRLEGNLDPLVFMGKKTGVRAGFKEIRVWIDMKSDASEEKLHQWAQAVELRCPVSDNLHNSTPLKIAFAR